MNSHTYPHLEQFLGGYFHQDWTLEAPQSMDVIRRYLGSAAAAEIAPLLTETKALIREALPEATLQNRLQKLGACFEPTGENTTASAWLKNLERALIEAERSKRS